MDNVIGLACPSCNNRLEVGDHVERFACAKCGVEYFVRRGGGIITLAPVGAEELAEGYEAAARRVMGYDLRQLERDLEVEMLREVNGIPGYMLLRYDYNKIGKLNFFHVGFANERTLENIFFSLTLDDIDRLLDEYAANPGGPTATWLRDVRVRMAKVQEKRKQLKALERAKAA